MRPRVCSRWPTRIRRLLLAPRSASRGASCLHPRRRLGAPGRLLRRSLFSARVCRLRGPAPRCASPPSGPAAAPPPCPPPPAASRRRCVRARVARHPVCMAPSGRARPSGRRGPAGRRGRRGRADPGQGPGLDAGLGPRRDRPVPRSPAPRAALGASPGLLPRPSTPSRAAFLGRGRALGGPLAAGGAGPAGLTCRRVFPPPAPRWRATRTPRATSVLVAAAAAGCPARREARASFPGGARSLRLSAHLPG